MDPAIAKSYRLTEPNPTYWSDPVDEESRLHRKNTRRATTRYSILQEEGRSHLAVGGAFEGGIPSDEPDPLGGSDSIVRLLQSKGLPVEKDLVLRNKYLISSKTFSPTVFLRDVHRDDTQQQLQAGLSFLSQSIEQKSQSLKILVENNFDRFVAAKGTIEGVYKEMKARSLSKDKEWGIADIKEPLSEASRKVTEIYGPVMAGRGKEESYRVMLEAIERHRPMFELPSTLAEHIRRKEYDSILEEYQKARKWVEEARSLVPSSGVGVKEANVHQLMIAERMWKDVGRSIDEFKRETWRRLVDTKQDDNFMELIGILLELGVEDNPIWVWLLSRYDYLKNKINKVFERARIEIEVARRKVAAMPAPSESSIAFYLRAPLRRIATEKAPPLDVPQNVELWELIYNTLASILSTTNGIVSEIVSFWETAENFIQGKAQVTLPVGIDDQSRRHHRLSSDGIKDLQAGGKELISLLRESIGSFFLDPPIEDISAVFSPIPGTPDSSVAPTPTTATAPSGAANLEVPKSGGQKSEETGEDFSFLPPNANSIAAMHYLSKILTLVGNAGSTLSALEIGKPGLDRMKAMITISRERCVQAICFTWQRDTTNCKLLEDWTRGPDSKDITRMPGTFLAIQSAVLSGLQRLIYLSEVKPMGGVEIIQPPSAKLVSNIRVQFVRSLYRALQGMVENAKRPLHSATWEEELADLATPSRALPARFLSTPQNPIDYTNKDIRLLLTLANLQFLRTSVIPELIGLFESSFGVLLTVESKSVPAAVVQIDAQLFDDYTRPKVKILEKLIKSGITAPEWGSQATPEDASPYTYSSLLTLVLVHAEVTATTPSLVQPVLSYLFESLFRIMLDVFRTITTFSVSQLLQATVDIEFLAQTLHEYETAKGKELQGAIYVECDRGSNDESRRKLQGELKSVRDLLSRLRKMTRAEFLCFRRKRSESKREGGERGREGSSTSASSR